MSMKVKVDVELPISVLLHKGLLRPIDGWLPFRIRAHVESIQVVVVGVEAEVASRYSIRVQYWHYLEAVEFQQDTGLFTAKDLCVICLL